MKVRQAAAAAVAATGALAQNATTPTTSYTTVTYSDCTSMSPLPNITITQGVTVTYCPQCDMGGFTTVYPTTYMSLCPTGLVPATYTVTESCSEATPTWTPGPSYIPQGFTVTTKDCTVCAETPTRVTITEPCGCEATNGVPVSNTNASTTPAAGPGGMPASGGMAPAAQTPAGGSGSSPAGGSGSSPAGGSGSSPAGSSPGSGSGSAPAAGSPGSGGAGSRPAAAAPAPGAEGGAAAPYPTGSTTTEACPGPACGAAASTGANYGNTNGIEPSPGAASSLNSMGLMSVLLATVVAALAFTL